MGTITGAQLSKDIGQTLSDSGHDNWTEADDIFPAVTEALRAIVMIRPDAYPEHGNIALEVGKAIQTLPSGGIILSSIIRNRGTDGTTNGPTITQVEKSVLDQTLPGWIVKTTETRIRNYIYTPEVPALFQVFPIPTAALNVEGVWGKAPTAITDALDVICIDDTYGPAIKEWALFRLQSMEVEGASINLAMAHQTNFFNLMGTKMSNQITALQLKGAL